MRTTIKSLTKSEEAMDTKIEMMQAEFNERRKERLKDRTFGELLDLLPEERQRELRLEIEKEIMDNFLDKSINEEVK